MKNGISKSNGVEIISLLWFILATQITYEPFKFLAIVMGIENTIESIVYSLYFKERLNKEVKS